VSGEGENMKSQKHIWVVQRGLKDGSIIPIWWRQYRKDARELAAYFNGFSKGTKNAKYRVKKYMEVE
jgi:hypothetical protein